MKFRKQQLPAAVPAGLAAKARLRNVGAGTVEFAGNTIKFYVKKGRFSKQRRLAKEIPIADIESTERVENEFSVTWKGVTDRFVFEKAGTAEDFHSKVTEALNVQRKQLATKEEAQKQKLNELTQALSNALKITDSLFDILRSLHGRVDWNHVESNLKYSRETFRSFANQKGAVTLDFTSLSSAIKERLPEDTSKEAYSILKALFEHFSGLTQQSGLPLQPHPNNDDAKKVVLAYYTLNDILLGIVVGDEDIGKELNELATLLDDLSKGTGLVINAAAIKDVINRLNAATDQQSVIAESRAVFVQQLKDLLVT